MDAKKKKISLGAAILVVALIVIVLYGIALYIQRISYNHVVHSADEKGSNITYTIYGRGGNTDRWYKDSKYLNHQKLQGKIFESVVKNNGGEDIDNWRLRIDFTRDCWINNAWNGTVEIHQNVNTQEKVQTLYLLDVDKDEIELDHHYDDGDLLIDLHAGDYLYYNPSKECYEDPILKYKGNAYIGFIIYTKYPGISEIYNNQISVTYNFKKTYTQGIEFGILVILIICWLLYLGVFLLLLAKNTRKKEVESQLALEEAYAEANRSNEAKSIFLANMSHEIRTPINSILGMNTMILRESNQEEIRKYAQDIENSGKTLLSIINDILDLSKIESGKMEILPNEYDVKFLVSNMINMVKPRAKEKGLELLYKVDSQVPSKLWGDETRIKQILLNILNNAVKYTVQGSVTLIVDFDYLSQEDIALRFSVQDTGIGIKSEDLDKLFARFERIEEERNKKIEGTGLGMSITQRLLELMNSKLEVSSVYGEGSCFSFELIQKIKDNTPVGIINLEEINSIEVFKENYHASKARILVVDDVKMNQVVIKSLLKRIKCQVDICSSGFECLKLSKENKYDLIFIDHMMPLMDGIETLKRLKTECALNSNTPKIALTANAIMGAKEEYLKNGFDGYLSKPVDGDELEKMIFELLPESLIDNNKETKSEENGFIEKLRIDSEIDINQGIHNSGNDEVYKRILHIFVESSAEEDDAIQQCLEALDYENYVVEVHGLKSNSKTIGAKKLAELAYELEMAGRNKDEALMKAKTNELIVLHKQVVNNIIMSLDLMGQLG